MIRIGFCLISLTLFIIPQPAFAHAFGQLYNLPIPFWFYIFGGATAIVVSFLIIGYFISRPAKITSYPTVYLSKFTLFDILAKPWFKNFLKTGSIFLFLTTITTGILGNDSSYSNFNMTFFWIIFVLGFTYLTAIIGNLWAIVNPFKILIELTESFSKEATKPILQYPPKLGYWPALAFYFIFIWLELLGKTTPRSLSLIIIQYTLINFGGVILFGKKSWFTYCEFFSVFLRLIAKVAPIEYIKGKPYIRPPFVGLLKNQADSLSLLLFILFMLSSTAFDGFRETVIWRKFIFGLLPESFLYSSSLFRLVQTIALALSPFIFLAIYLYLIGLMKIITKSKILFGQLSFHFAFSLVPIALAYNIAHYYTLLLTEGQNIIRLISDPLGFGWNLFGTANYLVNIGIVGANFVWHSQVAFILLGHIAAVYLAHLVALKIFPAQKSALVSQLPMLVLMVIYTITGLWILSQPLTTGL